MTRRAPQSYAGIVIDPGRARALADLRNHIGGLLDAGEVVPCCSTSAPLWISDDNGDQTIAAADCSACPALERCTSYITNWPEAGGVWAGLTESERSTRTKGPTND